MKNRIGLFKGRNPDTKGTQQHKSNSDMSVFIRADLIGASLIFFFLLPSLFSFSFFTLEFQLDWEYVDGGTLDLELPPRGVRYFQRRLGTQHRILFDWDTGGATIFFLICNPNWNGVMPPPEDQIELMGKGWEMNNERWHPPEEGDWFFIFNNDNTFPVPISIQISIFKIKGSPDIIDKWSIDYTTPSNNDDILSKEIIIVGAVIVIGISLGYKYYPRSTPTGTTKRIVTARTRKVKRDRRK